jgi:hypothetical protein
MLGVANSEDNISALIDSITSVPPNNSYMCLISVDFIGSSIFTAMGIPNTGGVIQIVGFFAGDNGYEAQRALSYYGAPVYRQRNAGTWASWKRYN